MCVGSFQNSAKEDSFRNWGWSGASHEEPKHYTVILNVVLAFASLPDAAIASSLKTKKHWTRETLGRILAPLFVGRTACCDY
jgi:hypothetical protein